MAKSLLELIPELQAAVEKAEANRATLEKVNTAAGAAVAAAKASYDAVVATQQAAQQKAASVYGESATAVRAIQDEINAQLGKFDARVRVG